MAVGLEPIRKVKCTYNDCPASFDTESQMRRHKREAPEHDYCHKCKEDFSSPEEFLYHKLKRPDVHNKACRICGDEFKSDGGLKLHIERVHGVDQRLRCICGLEFLRASQIVEHLEFGKCPVVSASEFVGRIVHKHLVSELLKGGINKDQFDAKIATFQAAVDNDTAGGVTLMDQQLEDDDVKGLNYAAIEPEVIDTPSHATHAVGAFPPLPSQKKDEDTKSVVSSKKGEDTESVISRLTELSLDDHFKALTTGQLPFSPKSQTTKQDSSISSTPKSSTSGQLPPASQTGSHSAVAAWTKNTAKALFPNAPPTPPPSEWSVQKQDKVMEQKEGLNIMQVRFWDPASKDFLAERFYSTVLGVYQCPFICAQKFDTPGDLSRHILDDHRITSMRCPSCLDQFRSCNALVAHCESGSRKCKIRYADDFGIFLNRLTGGFLGVKEKVRPDHLHNPAVMVTDPVTKKMEVYRPPVARYLQYTVTIPADIETKDENVAAKWGGPAVENKGLHK